MRSSDLETFCKINLFEFGAQLRQLKSKVPFKPQEVPRPGQEFSVAGYTDHLLWLSHLGVWFEAMGFSTRGVCGFHTALDALAEFCQTGMHHPPHVLEVHISHARLLYKSFVADMHQGLSCFWGRKLPAYDLLVDSDAMFLPGGDFYGVHRQMMRNLDRINVFTLFGYASAGATAGAQAAAPARRTSPPGAGSSSDTRLAVAPDSRGATNPKSRQARPDYSKVGSFNASVSEQGDVLTIGATRYSKTLILDKLGCRADTICLASFLCKKGAAACPCPGRAGHERHDSHLHVFSDAAVALRSSFDDPPFRLPPAADGPVRDGANRGRAGKRPGAAPSRQGRSQRK